MLPPQLTIPLLRYIGEFGCPGSGIAGYGSEVTSVGVSWAKQKVELSAVTVPSATARGGPAFWDAQRNWSSSEALVHRLAILGGYPLTATPTFTALGDLLLDD